MQILQRLRVAVVWTVIVTAVGLLVMMVLVPRIGGATPYTVLTGSMRPDLPPGTLVVVRPTTFEHVGIGDVITYQLRSGEPEVVTHRVTSIGFHPTKGRVLTTQGDANSTADALPVIEKQVRGNLWYSVPYLGYVNNALTGSQRQVATYGIAGILALYATCMFTSSLRDRRREQNNSSEEVAS